MHEYLNNYKSIPRSQTQLKSYIRLLKNCLLTFHNLQWCKNYGGKPDSLLPLCFNSTPHCAPTHRNKAFVTSVTDESSLGKDNDFLLLSWETNIILTAIKVKLDGLDNKTKHLSVLDRNKKYKNLQNLPVKKLCVDMQEKYTYIDLRRLENLQHFFINWKTSFKP